MGIESDQVVYEYLSRVGDVAQQRQLPSAARMRLVSELRNEIDRRRAKAPADSPAAVRRILSRLGSPDEVVAAAGGTGTGAGGAAQPPAASVPVQPDGEPKGGERPRGLRRAVPRPRPADPAPAAPSAAPSPPHMASTQELGDTSRADWWRVDSTPFGVGDSVPGFVGGVEIPELLKPPAPKEPEQREKGEQEPVEAPAPVPAKAQDVPAAPRRRFLPRRAPAAGGWSNPLLLLAAALLVGGAVLGNWFALLFGWVIAYASRRLTQTESKWAVMGMPGIAVTAGIVWLWGRGSGRWGTPVAEGHMNDAIAQTWPWVVRGAAVLSALYLVWRSQKVR